MAEITRAWVVEIKPTKQQEAELFRWAGTCRFLWNWGLEQVIKAYEEEEKYLSNYTLSKMMTELQATEEFAWWNETPRTSREAVFQNLDLAFKAFFRRCKSGEKPGYPKFKSRERTIPSIRFRQVQCDRKRGIDLPRIRWIRVKEDDYLPTRCRRDLNLITVRYHGAKWWASVNGDWEVWPMDSTGITAIVNTALPDAIRVEGSTGESYQMSAPFPLREDLRKLQRLSRWVSRKQKDSNRRMKMRKRFQKFHSHVSSKREYQLHLKTTELVRRYDGITLITPKGGYRLENEPGLPHADAALGEFARQLRYKCGWYGRTYEEQVEE